MAARKAVGWRSLGGRSAQQAFEVVAARSFSRVSDFSFLGKIRWSTKCGKTGSDRNVNSPNGGGGGASGRATVFYPRGPGLNPETDLCFFGSEFLSAFF